MKENISFSSKCLSSFSTRPAVNLVGVKRFPPTSPSLHTPITFIVLTTVDVQGHHHSEKCLDLVMGYQGRRFGLRLCIWLECCPPQPLGWATTWCRLWPAPLESYLWEALVPGSQSSSLMRLQWTCNGLFTAFKGAWKMKAASRT